jgi:triosephosphate isomerase
MKIVFCIGEELTDRNNNNHFDIIESQLRNGIFHIESSQFKNIIIAYEPVWAIGTGMTANSDQIQEMHQFIRGLVNSKYGNEISQNIKILYGGSVKPSNAKEIFSLKDIDGGLIGGASLNFSDFNSIVEAANE